MSSSAYKGYTDERSQTEVLQQAEATISEFLASHATIVAGNIQRNGSSPLQEAILPTIRNERNLEVANSGRIYIETSGSDVYTQFFREFFRSKGWKMALSISADVGVRVYLPGTAFNTRIAPNTSAGHGLALRNTRNSTTAGPANPARLAAALARGAAAGQGGGSRKTRKARKARKAGKAKRRHH